MPEKKCPSVSHPSSTPFLGHFKVDNVSEITIMLSICIFQNYVAEMSPPTSEAVPFLGAFFAVCMFTCAVCVTATAMALNFHNRGSATHEMSYLVSFSSIIGINYW